MSKLFLVLDFVYNSRATCLLIYSGIRRNTQSHCSGPLSHVVSDIELWPIRLKLLMVPSYFTLDIFLSTIRGYFLPHSLSYVPDSQPGKARPSRVFPPYPFRKYDEDPEERMTISSL